MYELKKNGKVFTSKFVGTGPSSYEKRIYRSAVSQSLRNTDLRHYMYKCHEIGFLSMRVGLVAVMIEQFNSSKNVRNKQCQNSGFCFLRKQT